MSVIQYNSIAGTISNFSAAADVLYLPGSASDYVYAQSGAGVTITHGAQVTKLKGISLAQITTSNFIFAETNSHLVVGDNMLTTTDDDLSQTDLGPLDLFGSASSYLNKSNVLFGMGGPDTISVGNDDNIVYGGTGESDTTDGGDRIVINGGGGTSGNNHIFTNAGNDTVIFTNPTGLGKTSIVRVGIGDDNVIISNAAGIVNVYGGRGNDTINGAGATGSITILGNTTSADTVDGADILTSGLGNSAVHGNAGDDVLFYDDFAATASQILTGGAGADTISGDIGGTGSLGKLLIYGNRGSDTIDTTSHLGNVTIYGGNGAGDSLDTADTILVGSGSAGDHTYVYGNGGADTITSTANLAAGETLAIFGGVAADTIVISGARANSSGLTVDGGTGNDIFKINDSALISDATVTFTNFEKTDSAQITLSGGSAIDIVATNLGSSATLTNNFGAGLGAYVFQNYAGTFTAINLTFGDGSVFLSNVGGTTTAALSGTANNDQLIAGSKGDALTGGAGNDILTGGDGADSLNGGDGVDTITGGAGNDTILAGDGGIALDGIADSSIRGGEGSDSITGGANEDSINGGLANDTIAGGLGADTISGGLGADTFSYKIAELAASDTLIDLVTDAFTGEADVIDFSDLSVGSLRGTGIEFAQGNASTAQTLDANAGIYVATNTVASFSEADIYSALSGIADDLATGDIIYALVSNGTDARLVRITEVANPGSLAAVDDTLEFVARLQGVTHTELASLTEGNFADFN
ncbi:MAG: calcium-binding protein [Rickettsiales bacterium]